MLHVSVAVHVSGSLYTSLLCVAVVYIVSVSITVHRSPLVFASPRLSITPPPQVWARSCRHGEPPQPDLLAQLPPDQLPTTGLTVRVHDDSGHCTHPPNVNVVCTRCMRDPSVRARLTPEPPLALTVSTTEETSVVSVARTACAALPGVPGEHDAQSGHVLATGQPGATMVAPADIGDADVFASYNRAMMQAGQVDPELALVEGPNAAMLFGNELLDGEWAVDGQVVASPGNGLVAEPWMGASEELTVPSAAVGVGGHHDLDSLLCALL